MSLFKRKHARILKHHRNTAVYIDGRYLHVDTKISTQSVRGRELARETAAAILGAVGKNENAHLRFLDNIEHLRRGEALVKAEGERIPTEADL